MLACFVGSATLMFIPFPSVSSLLSILSIFAFRWAGSGVRVLSGSISPCSSSLVSTFTGFGGNHSPALQSYLGRVCRGLEHCWRGDGWRWEIWKINTGSKSTLKTKKTPQEFRKLQQTGEQDLCTYETLVCIICHSLVSHLQGDAQTQLWCVYIHPELQT